MTEPATCPSCRKTLPADAPDGMCPECLLRAGIGTGGRAPAAPHDAAAIERRLPQFEVTGLLGRGGMGVVWRARHRTLDRDVALKVLAPEAAAAPGFAERFRREARALARLDHPNIVRVHDSGETDGLFWLAMDLVEGTSLRQAMSAGAVRPHEALAIVRQICDALEYAHSRGVVHRDIKPENVLLSRDGRVKVADFGIAKLAESRPDEGLTVAGQVVGTAHYMAPEQVERPGSVDHRADIYSLGVVFYELLTGELPIGRFAPPSAKVRIDVRLDEIVLRTLEKEREARYQRASEVRTSVDAVGSGDAGPAGPQAASHWSRSWAAAGGWVAVAGAAWALGVSTTNDAFAVVAFAGLVAAVWIGVRAQEGGSRPWRLTTFANRWAWIAAGVALGATGIAFDATPRPVDRDWFLPLAVPGAVLALVASTWSPRCVADPARPRIHPLATRSAWALLAAVALQLAVVAFADLRRLSQTAQTALGASVALPVAAWIVGLVAIVRIAKSKGAWRGLWLATVCVVVPVVATVGIAWIRRVMGPA